MAKDVIDFEIDEQTLNEVNNVLEEIGIDMEEAINLFLEEIVHTGEIPIEISGTDNSDKNDSIVHQNKCGGITNE